MIMIYIYYYTPPPPPTSPTLHRVRSVRVERITTTITSSLTVPGVGARQQGRGLAKLLLERSVLSETSDVYLTPDTTLLGHEAEMPQTPVTPDVVPRPEPRSPASEEYRTPDCSGIEDHSFAMPSYFDRKKRAASVIVAAVQPLANFQAFKQKSLNTIPASVERTRKSEELFVNFPFLTPLAHRKGSLASAATRLSGCLEDEFYTIPTEKELAEDGGSFACVDVRQRLRPAAPDEPHALRHSCPAGARNPSSGSLTASASESGSLERARAKMERRPPEEQHVTSCRVENTRVNPDSLIDELLAATDLKHAADDPAETSGLQLYITRDGTAELGSRRRQQLARSDYQRVVLHPHDNRSKGSFYLVGESKRRLSYVKIYLLQLHCGSGLTPKGNSRHGDDDGQRRPGRAAGRSLAGSADTVTALRLLVIKLDEKIDNTHPIDDHWDRRGSNKYYLH
ncbi:FAM102A protein [Danaus plexippus plexippus]|uniref:FAM102A protein n=1 Tax=Danaus plexippus plexippus TaxID=278856 RepID=A0A212F5E1_DANPL|nr:FAM102A protein [Danaus plexippus plexippus]